MGNSRVTIEDSVFTRNEIRGLNFRDCRNEIRRNLVYENGDGIFLHSKDAASIIRENAIYANRHFNLRMGDLHAEDVDAGGNWWGTAREGAAREKIYDGANLPGTGHARLAPVLPRPPVAGSEIRGVMVSGQSPVEGAEVRAMASLAEGFFSEEIAGSAVTDSDGLFSLPVPPGRWFVAGRRGEGAGSRFSFPGRNPVTVAFGERVAIAMPAVTVTVSGSPRSSASTRPGVLVRATSGALPVAGVTVQAFRPDAPDFRGPGEASALTGEAGTALLALRPGKYLLTARKRPGGAALGVVEEGGLFGVWPGSPVDLQPGTAVAVEIPMFEKKGFIGREEPAPNPGGVAGEPVLLHGTASLNGSAADRHIVYFYRPPETIGRPVARSSVISGEGSFSVSLPEEGAYATFLRKSIPGVPGGVGEERFGPVPVRVQAGRIVPAALRFGTTPQ